MVHAIIGLDCDKNQHERLLQAMNNRKYAFEKHRKGFSRPVVSEIKFYNVRMKKEVLPQFLTDLGCGMLFPEEKVSLWKVIKGLPKGDKPDAFFSGRITLLTSYLIQKFGGLVRLKPAKKSDNPQQKFVDGWYYPFFLGSIEDINRGFGEEL